MNLFVQCFSIRNLKKYEKKDGEHDTKKDKSKSKDKQQKQKKADKGKDGKVKDAKEEETEGSRKKTP